MPSWALKIVYNYEWIYYIVTYYHTKVELEKMHEKVKFACEYLSSLCASVSFHVLISLSCSIVYKFLSKLKICMML